MNIYISKKVGDSMNIKNLSTTIFCIIKLICKGLVIELNITIVSKIFKYFQI